MFNLLVLLSDSINILPVYVSGMPILTACTTPVPRPTITNVTDVKWMN